MPYLVNFTPQAEKDLACLDKIVAQKIVNKIDWLSQNIENIFPIALKGKFKDKYKLRVGDWRVIYSIEHDSYTCLLYTSPSPRDS